MKPSYILLCLGVSACGGAAPHPPATLPASAATERAAPPVASAAMPQPVAAPTSAAPLTPGVVIVGDIVGPPQFDPKPALASMKPDLLRCYNETRTLIPTLHGKLTLRVKVDETGAVTSTEAAPGGHADDPGLVACIGDAMKTAKFPKPGGSATMTIPLVFRP